jgi:homoserine dehydrogenase
VSHVSIGLLGCGAVGSNLVSIIRNSGIDPSEMNIYGIAVKDTSKPRDVGEYHVTDDVEWLINSEGINVIVDALPGIQPSLDLVTKAIKNGKFIITCNKELVQRSGEELSELVKQNRSYLYLNSIPASATPDPLDDVEINQDTLGNFSQGDLYGFKGAGGYETALYIFKDLMKMLNKAKSDLARWADEDNKLSQD